MVDDVASYRFDRFEIRPARRQLLVDGEPAKVGSRAFDLLVVLIERREKVVTKGELFDLVWPGVVVEEGNLHVHIVALRKLLGPGSILTIPGRGYKIAVTWEGTETPAPVTNNPVASSDPAGFTSNLPTQLPPLYGRSEDIAALQGLVGRHRLVSIVGPGGIGKTRLARAVAHGFRGAYADGTWLVELAPLTDPELMVSTVARVLGHTLQPKGSAAKSLIDAIREQKLLLVLDNCEHLAGCVNELAGAILAEAPGVHLLITSQEPLRRIEENAYRLQPLAVPETADAATALDYGSVALFVARTQAVDASFALHDDNVAAVVDVCASLGGIALAIELAAARVSLLGVQGVRQRLGERLKLLAGGERSALPRHRTLRAALEWSYSLLTDDERAVLDRLGVFIGSFSLEAAQKVCADDHIDEWVVLEHLATLVDKSLVIVDSGEPPRYRLLESGRFFAMERLAAIGAVETMRRRHAQALEFTLAQGGGWAESPSKRVERKAPDLDNVRAALAWATGPDGDRAIAIELAGASNHLWNVLGQNDEGALAFRAIEPWVDASTPPAVAARFWLAVSNVNTLNWVRGQAEAGLRAADLFRSIGDREGLFWASGTAASRFSFNGDSEATERALAEAIGLLDTGSPSWARGYIEFVSGHYNFYCVGQPEKARLHYLAGLDLLGANNGDNFHAEVCELMVVFVDYSLRRLQDAIQTGRELLKRPNARFSGFSRALVGVPLGAALVATGDLAEAEATLRTAWPRVKRAAGTVNWAISHVAFLAARQGRLGDAAKLIGYNEGSRTSQLIVQSPIQRLSIELTMAILKPALSAKDLERFIAEGRTLTEDEATALALPQVGEIDYV